MKIGQNITSASSTLWFLQLWITSYFPMFVAKQPKSATTLDQDAQDPTLGKVLRIKSTTSGSAYYFVEANFNILDNVDAL